MTKLAHLIDEASPFSVDLTILDPQDLSLKYTIATIPKVILRKTVPKSPTLFEILRSTVYCQIKDFSHAYMHIN